jgi:hypothetical protein
MTNMTATRHSASRPTTNPTGSRHIGAKQGFGIFRTARRNAQTLSVGFMVLASSSAGFGAGGPTVTVAGQPIEIQGVVATMDDALRQPFLNTTVVGVPEGEPGGSIFFDVPEGKRLIVETVTFRVSAAADVAVDVQIFAVGIGGLSNPSYLSYQTTPSPSGASAVHTGTHPIKMRVDYRPGHTDEIELEVSRGPSTGGCVLTASILGYLVDI